MDKAGNHRKAMKKIKDKWSKAERRPAHTVNGKTIHIGSK